MSTPQRPLQFGAIEGILEGQTFANRREVFAARLHRHTRFGISGNQFEGCDAVIVSGVYEDDDDRGEILLYTGEGGRDPQTGKQIAHQELVKGNLALALSGDKKLPVRVIRGAGTGKYGPEGGYRYDGLYRVTKRWREPGKSGFLVWRFRLEKIEALT